MRGKRTRERRAGDQAIADAFARRDAGREERGFDVAEVGREVDDARGPAPAARPVAAPVAPPVRGAGRRLPDLSVLPPLLQATGSFESLRDRLGAPGRHAGLVAVPHGAKTYLAAALALGATGERLVWVARDAEIGDRVAEELGAWLGDADAIAVLEPRTALAYERSELVPDETAARVAALAAWRSGRARILVASVQALLQHTLSPEDLPPQPRRLTTGTHASPDVLARELLDLGYVPVLEVAGRGEFARRGGILDVFPPSSPLPVRIEFFGDEIDSLRAFDPADQRTVRPTDTVAFIPASEFLLPASGVDVIAGRLGRAAAKLPGRPRGGPPPGRG